MLKHARGHRNRFARVRKPGNDEMKCPKDGEATLLDSTMLMAGASLADPNNHDHRDLPVLVAGGLMKGNRHVIAPKDTPMANLMLSMMDTLGVDCHSIGDSSGRLSTFSA